MSGLPNAHLAKIDQRKIVSYLLSDKHPAGRSKAAFFRRFGFGGSSWQELRDALLDHATRGELVSLIDTEFGKKYIVQGPLPAPDGRKPLVRAVWFVETGEAVARLVTAYPVQGSKE